MPVTKVPKDQVGQVVQDFVDNGETEVEARKESAGTFEVGPTNASNNTVTRARSFAAPAGFQITPFKDWKKQHRGRAPGRPMARKRGES